MSPVEILTKVAQLIETECDDVLQQIQEDLYLSVHVKDVDIIITQCHERQDYLIFKSSVGSMDFEAANALKVTQFLLEANFEWSGTRGSTLGVNSNTGEICLFYSATSVNADVNAIIAFLSIFADTVKEWNELLDHLVTSGD